MAKPRRGNSISRDWGMLVSYTQGADTIAFLCWRNDCYRNLQKVYYKCQCLTLNMHGLLVELDGLKMQGQRHSHPKVTRPYSVSFVFSDAKSCLTLALQWSFALFMGFSQQGFGSDLPFPPPVDYVLSELFTRTRPSWVALNSTAHSFIELCKTPSPQQGCDPWREFSVWALS